MSVRLVLALDILCGLDLWGPYLGTVLLQGPSWQDEVGEKGTFSQRFVSL